MNNINILALIAQFDNPYLLLILIPAVILAFWPFFRMRKDKRCTRNRIVSMILHLMILCLSALVLSGFTVKDTAELNYNKAMILVDISDSNYGNKKEINDYIKKILAEKDANMQVGIYAFGCGEVREISPLSKNPKFDGDAFKDNGSDTQMQNDGFIRAEGTDIASALRSVAAKFGTTSLKACKLILISDGIETDGDGLQTAKDLHARGLVIDSIYVKPYDYEGKTEMLVENFQPEMHSVEDNVPIKLTLTVKSHHTGSFTFKVFDYAGTDKEEEIDISQLVSQPITIAAQDVNNETVVEIPAVAFTGGGVHPIKVEINPSFGVNEGADDYWDDWDQNNSYYSYVVVQEESNKILIVDGSDSDNDANVSDFVTAITTENNDKYEVNKCKLADAPNDFSDYNEVILINVDTTGKPTFAKNIERYVKNGGGLLTMGGDHTYYDGGMAENKMDDVLPVNVIPSDTDNKAVYVCVDFSSGMNGGKGSPGFNIMDKVETGLRLAISKGAISEDDYVGMLVFGGKITKNGSDSCQEILPLTSGGSKAAIYKALDTLKSLDSMGNTEWRRPQEIAAQKLQTSQAANKHIIFITDAANDTEEETSNLTVNGVKYPNGGWAIYNSKVNGTDGDANKTYSDYLYDNYGITMSTMLVCRSNPQYIKDLKLMARVDADTEKKADGEGNFYNPMDEAAISDAVEKEFLSIPTKPVSDEGEYDVTLNSPVDLINNIAADSVPFVTTTNGCTLKPTSTVYAKAGEFDLFIYWNYDKGKSGALMTDIVDDKWGSSILKDPEGRIFIRWMVDNCYAVSSTGLTQDADYTFSRKNFTTTVSVTNISNPDINYIEVAVFDQTKDINVQAINADTDKTMLNKLAELVPEENSTTLDKNVGDFIGDVKMMVPGLYTVTFMRAKAVYNEEGDVESFDKLADKFAVPFTYETFSYSDEYNTFLDKFKAANTLSNIAEETGGKMEADLTVSAFAEQYAPDSVWNPQLLFMVIALLLFILDVCARKFHFLWPHEIIRKIQGKEIKPAS